MAAFIFFLAKRFLKPFARVSRVGEGLEIKEKKGRRGLELANHVTSGQERGEGGFTY